MEGTSSHAADAGNQDSFGTNQNITQCPQSHVLPYGKPSFSSLQYYPYAHPSLGHDQMAINQMAINQLVDPAAIAPYVRGSPLKPHLTQPIYVTANNDQQQSSLSLPGTIRDSSHMRTEEVPTTGIHNGEINQSGIHGAQTLIHGMPDSQGLLSKNFHSIQSNNMMDTISPHDRYWWVYELHRSNSGQHLNSPVTYPSHAADLQTQNHRNLQLQQEESLPEVKFRSTGGIDKTQSASVCQRFPILSSSQGEPPTQQDSITYQDSAVPAKMKEKLNFDR